MQYKKIEIYGRDLEDFKPKRNPLSESVYPLTINQSVALTYLVHKWMSNEEDGFLMTTDEASDLLKRLRKHIGYEEI